MANLLLFNYSMDETDPVFPHQIKIARSLSQHFEKVYVITNTFKEPIDPLPSNIFVHQTNWKSKHALTNIYRLIVTFFRIINDSHIDYVFSHMTEVQSAILAPFIRMMNIRHLLWYAHKSRSRYLVWNSFWVDKILTSTRESCPLKSNKVLAIGQGVDDSVFSPPPNRDYSRKSKWIHVGRIDPSKRIEVLINMFMKQVAYDRNLELILIGSPTEPNQEYALYVQGLIHNIGSTNIQSLGRQNQLSINAILGTSDLFLHAFQGSLDKALVEATLTGITVITCNLEYLREFGSLTKNLDNFSDFEILEIELKTYLESTPEQLAEIAKCRARNAVKMHSQSQWLRAVVQAIEGDV